MDGSDSGMTEGSEDLCFAFESGQPLGIAGKSVRRLRAYRHADVRVDRYDRAAFCLTGHLDAVLVYSHGGAVPRRSYVRPEAGLKYRVRNQRGGSLSELEEVLPS